MSSEAIGQCIGESDEKLRLQEIRVSAIDMQVYDQLLEVQDA